MRSVLSAGHGHGLLPGQGERHRPPGHLTHRHSAPSPTGNRLEVPVTDLIYTATNTRGSIIEANAVFTRVCGYGREDLLGVPHNLIRHPDMPGGVFRAIWNELTSEHAAAGYVQNLTADGTAYWTYATFTPGGGGHLSIRQRPCTEMFPVIADLYLKVRRHERELRAGGSSTVEAAMCGHTRLLNGLRDLGFTSYRDFVLATLPAEVAGRAHQGGGTRPGALEQANLQELFLVVNRNEQRVRELAVALHENRVDDAELDQLIAAARDNAGTLGVILEGCGVLLAEVVPVLPALTQQAPALAGRCHQIGDALLSLISSAESLRSARQQMRCNAALAQLQAETMSRYLSSMASGDETADASGHTVERLTDALHQEFHAIGDGLRLAWAMSGQLDALGRSIGLARQELAGCRAIIHGTGLADQLEEHMMAMDGALNDAAGHLARMRAMAERFSRAVSSFDPAGASCDIVRLDQALRRQLS